MVEFNNKSRPKTKEGKDKKRYLWKCICSLTHSAFKKGIFPIRKTQGEGLKILTPK